MARIFISHSAKSESDSADLLALADALTAARHLVLLDRTELNVADDWNLRISNWMVDCHGAVVLMSPHALQSNFVKLEISNLLTRWRRDNLFPFCVVLLPGVTAADIRQGFYGAVRLADNQFITASHPSDALPQLLDRFSALPGSDAPSTALAALEQQIVEILSNAPVAALAGGAAAAGCDGGRAVTPRQYAERLGPFLLRCSMATAFRALRELRRGLSRDRTAELFELIAPSWVPPEAGYELAAIIDRPAAAAARAVMINGVYPQFTPSMYLRRAYAHLPGWSGTVTDAPHGRTGTLDLDSLLYQVRVTIVGKLGEDPEVEPVALEHQVAALLGTREVLGIPVVVPLRLEPVQRELLAGLASRPEFRAVTFIALCGVDAVPLADDPWLRPELQLTQERSAYYQYQAIQSLIRSET